MKNLSPIHFILIFASVILLNACREDYPKEELIVYQNDFETDFFEGVKGVYVSRYFGTKVMGRYHNAGFDVSLKNLPEHEYIRVRFDLYIHDSWEGNSNQIFEPGRDHDAWIMEFDQGERIQTSNKIYFETTFSNSLCRSDFCHDQSYPREFPFSNDARTGAASSRTGVCIWSDTPDGTSMYEFDRFYPHERKNTTISFYDQLVTNNPELGDCDESWSLDNLTISVF
jgi:hypothetical protein